MIDQQIEIPTRDGHTTTFITHPERGGPFPVVIFYMDAPAIREELREMARRLATCGYYVMLPNLYYRSGVMELGPLPADPESPERKRMFQLMNSINIPLVMADTKALLDYADGQTVANTKIVGTVGYCMSGRYAINAATHFSDRVKAAASIYGTQLATDQPDSPHLAAAKTRAELYFGCAETDVYAPIEIIEKIRAANEGCQRRGRDLSRHPSRVCLPEASGLRPRRRRAALGAAARALSAQSLPLDRNDLSSNRHPAPCSPLSMIFSRKTGIHF
jgi:carboxymethylenebutenolidase